MESNSTYVFSLFNFLEIPNVNFYWANGESLPFESGSFDIVHFTYVLHEMPATHAQLILNEAFRLLKPGGVISGFDVPFESDIVLREGYILFNTWGWLGDYDQKKYGFHGPEPFMYEYEENLQLPLAMENTGFANVTYSQYSIFDAIYYGVKPLSQ
jgi:ubiquinone/menaquinone biosynthesis C-methylase UbiE